MARVGCVVIGVIVVSGLFSFWQEYRAEQTLAALLKLLPQAVKVVRDGMAMSLAVTELVPGDIVLLAQGDNIPADCRLIEAFGVRVNTATITGESLPKARDAEPSAADELINSRNILLTGTSMVVRRSQGRGLRHGDAHGIRQDRASDSDRQGGRLAIAPGDCPPEPLDRDPRSADRTRVLRDRLGPRRSVLGRFHLRHRPHRRHGAGRAAPHADFGTGACHEAPGQTQRPDPLSPLGRSVGFDDGDLHRQDRDADAEPDDGQARCSWAARSIRSTSPHEDRNSPSGTGRSFSRPTCATISTRASSTASPCSWAILWNSPSCKWRRTRCPPGALSPSWTRYPSTRNACGSPPCMPCHRPPRCFAREPPRPSCPSAVGF